ncbi:MAG: M56 family metallopeptidase [Clostridium sp.]
MSTYIMGFLEKTFLIFFQTSLTAGILAIIVFAVLKVFNNRLSIRIKYLLCSLILLRCIVPAMTQNNIDLNVSQILNNIQAYNHEDLVNEDRNDSISKDNEIKMFNEENEKNIFIDHEQSNIGNKDIQNKGNDILRNVVDSGAILWCIGIVVLTGILIVSLLNFKIKSSNLEKIKDEHIIKILNKLKQNINLKTDISMYICDDKKSPCILGFVKPKIYLPQYVLNLDDNMISHILLHELMHYKRKDLYINLLCCIMILLHWFNPLVWIAEKKLKTYREYACDSCVLQILGEEKNMDYGMTIINL